jgi:hypothetical protein
LIFLSTSTACAEPSANLCRRNRLDAGVATRSGV